MQMIIWSGQPLANDHPISFSCVKSVSQYDMFIFWDQKHNQKTLDKLTVRWGGGIESTLMVSLAVKYPFFYAFPQVMLQ